MLIMHQTTLEWEVVAAPYDAVCAILSWLAPRFPGGSRAPCSGKLLILQKAVCPLLWL